MRQHSYDDACVCGGVFLNSDAAAFSYSYAAVLNYDAFSYSYAAVELHHLFFDAVSDALLIQSADDNWEVPLVY